MHVQNPTRLQKGSDGRTGLSVLLYVLTCAEEAEHACDDVVMTFVKFAVLQVENVAVEDVGDVRPQLCIKIGQFNTANNLISKSI